MKIIKSAKNYLKKMNKKNGGILFLFTDKNSLLKLLMIILLVLLNSKKNLRHKIYS